MPRFSFFLEYPAEIHVIRSTAAHVIPWVRYTGAAGFWTKRDTSKFTVHVLGDNLRTLEIVKNTGSKLRVRESEWKGSMVDYLEMQRLDGMGYKRFPRINRFLWPMFEEFFWHLFHGECFCLNQDTLIGTSARAKEYSTSPWDA